jgi:hypothetical protein
MHVTESPEDTDAIIVSINARHRTDFSLLSRAPLGESGAYFLSDSSNARYVLKFRFGESSEFQPERACKIADRLRGIGYPAPRYVACGEIGGVSYAVQSLMQGAARQPLTLSHVAQLIAFNRLQGGLGGELPACWPDRIVNGVLEGYEEYCVIDTMRQYSAETSAMLSSLQHVVDSRRGDHFVTGDIVHWDFNPANILTEPNHVTGIIDWDGACAGDRGFDLATLAFCCYDSRAVRDPLMREALAYSSAGPVATYLAHMIVRQLDWSIRQHSAATVKRHLAISRRVLEDLKDLKTQRWFA